MSLQDPAILFRKGAALASGEPRTLIVLGAARGGTTMVAQMLHDLGVCMGQGLDSTYQDGAMNGICRALFDGQITIAHPVIEQVLRHRDRQFAVWGWKFPTHIFEQLYDKTRHPHVIAVFRDPVAIATRESVSHGYNVVACLPRALEQISNLTRFVLETRHPCLSLSYERGLARKDELVDALLDFAGITASPAARRQAAQRAQPGSARYLDETKARTVEGTIDGVDRRITGWLRYPHQINRRVAFTVLIDDVPVYDGVADRFRADLKEAFNNDGSCSFVVATPPSLLDGRPHKVTIAVPDEDQHLITNTAMTWTLTEQ